MSVAYSAAMVNRNGNQIVLWENCHCVSLQYQSLQRDLSEHYAQFAGSSQRQGPGILLYSTCSAAQLVINSDLSNASEFIKGCLTSISIRTGSNGAILNLFSDGSQLQRTSQLTFKRACFHFLVVVQLQWHTSEQSH